MNFEEKLENLKEEFRVKIEQLKEEYVKKEFPQEGDRYFFVHDNGEVVFAVMSKYNNRATLERKTIGNVFKTKEDAEFMAERLKVIAELKKFGKPFERREDNYYLTYDLDFKIIRIFNSVATKRRDIYFESAEKVKEVIKTVGEDRIKKYYLGGNYEIWRTTRKCT